MSISRIDETNSLLAEYGDGNRAIVNRLLRRHRSFLRRIVRVRLDRRLRQRLDASDIVQDAQLEVARRLDDYLERRPMSFRAWLHLTVVQQMRTAWRRHRAAQRRNAGREMPIQDHSHWELARRLARYHPPQEDDHRESIERVRQAVGLLAPIYQEVLLLRDFESLTNREAAEVLGISETAASKRHARALLRLRRLLRGGESDA